MGFEDIFENKQLRHRNYKEQKRLLDGRNSYDSQHSDHRNDNNLKLFKIIERIKSNRKLQLLVVVAGILIVALVIGLIIIFLPLIIKLFSYISQNGLQGILDSIAGFLDKIWKGLAK